MCTFIYIVLEGSQGHGLWPLCVCVLILSMMIFNMGLCKFVQTHSTKEKTNILKTDRMEIS